MAEHLATVSITCDDVGNSRHSHPLDSLKQFASILDSHGVHGTFFVIPNDGGDSPLNEDGDLVSVLGAVLDKGHEIAMHGYTHHILEFGPPRPFILRIDATAIYLSEMARRQQEILSTHTLESHLNKIQKGLEEFGRALNKRPSGFRAGWGSYNQNMFKALSMEGFLYDSSVFKPEAERPKPYFLTSGVLEIPMDLDYAWCLSQNDLELSLARAKEAFSQSSLTNSVFVPLLHHWAMTKFERLGETYDFSLGFKLLDELIRYIKSEGKVQFSTMTEVYESSSQLRNQPKTIKRQG